MSEDFKNRPDASRKDGKNGFIALFGTMCSAVFGVDPTDTESTRYPESPLTNFDHDGWSNFPAWRLSSIVIYQVSFLALLIYFIVTSYVDARTNSFITLDKTSGVCKDDSSSNSCCEVPQTITGTFLADSRGKWNTQNGFSYINNNYAVTVAGLEYTNEQWAAVMKNITSQISSIGLKGENRDLAWNMIAWSSFTAQNLDRGFLQFYATGQTAIIFDKPIPNFGVASAVSQTAQCSQRMDLTYSPATSNLDVSVELCSDDDGMCDNPCPGILAPQAMGYDPLTNQGQSLDITLNMQAISTALAVNLGMVALNHLVMVPGDNARITLLDTMVSQGSIDALTANHTTSYFDSLHSPTPPIYCHSALAPVQDSNTWLSGDSFCLVRIGNTLAYPVITSYGWSPDGVSYPKQCSKSASNVAGSAAKFYCNKFDINVGLIYYPVPNLNTTPGYYTYAPSKAPTNRPTPLPGFPTWSPTNQPSVKPTRLPTFRPTPPPGAPTCSPTTHRPSRKPSAAPSAVPTTKPNISPTVAPSAARRQLFADSDRDIFAAGDPTQEPTAEPTVSYAGDDYVYGEDDGAGDDAGGGDDGADDGSPLDDVYATTGIGTYSSPYYANSATDDFVPLYPIVADNGLIFKLGKVAAAQLNKVNSSNGDLFVSNNAYFAMVDTVVGTLKDKSRGFKKDFNKLCSSSVDPSVAAGCAMFAFNFDGDNDRDISAYFYQPSSTPAYSNTLYVKNELIALQKNTPTSLIQTYYSCVLAPWPALLAAVGIGTSSAGVFLLVGFAFYVFVTLFVLNRYFGANIPSKKAMDKAAQAQQDLNEQEVQRMIVLMEAMRADIDSGRINMPNVAEAFRTTDADIQKAQDASGKAPVERGSSSTPALEMNPMRRNENNA